MASTRPALAAVPKDSEIARLVQAADCGVWVPPEDPQSLSQSVQKLSQQPELLQLYGANGRSYVVEHFDRQLLTRCYYQSDVSKATCKKLW